MSKHKSNEFYKHLYEHADEVVSAEEIARLEAQALQNIRTVCKRYCNICVGYSAGKESLVVTDLMRKSFCPYTPVIWRTIFQWPSVTRWIEMHKPNGLVSVPIARPTWDDLAKTPTLLFPKTPADNNWWMSQKWSAQKRYFIDNHVDLFVTGRRLGDGNNCGKKSDNFLRKSKHYDVFSPVAEWTDEQIYGYMKYNGITLPPNYNTPLGFIYGSGAWAERMCYGNTPATDYEQWTAIYETDPRIVAEASKHLTSAKEFCIIKAYETAQEGIKAMKKEQKHEYNQNEN